MQSNELLLFRMQDARICLPSFGTSEAFAAVARAEGSLAAQRGSLAHKAQCGTTGAADLKTLLGVALFDRGGRDLALTDAGRALLDDARTLLAEADAFAARAGAAASGRVGRLAIRVRRGGDQQRPRNRARGVSRGASGRRPPRLVDLGGVFEARARWSNRGRWTPRWLASPFSESPALRRVAVGLRPYRAVLAAGHPLAGAGRVLPRSAHWRASRSSCGHDQAAPAQPGTPVRRACSNASFRRRVAQEAVERPDAAGAGRRRARHGAGCPGLRRCLHAGQRPVRATGGGPSAAGLDLRDPCRRARLTAGSARLRTLSNARGEAAPGAPWGECVRNSRSICSPLDHHGGTELADIGECPQCKLRVNKQTRPKRTALPRRRTDHGAPSTGRL